MKHAVLVDLTDEQLIQAIRTGNEEAQDYLLHKYKLLVKIKASAYYIMGGDREDIIQEGMIGLYKAVQDYDPARGQRFYFFAEMCISRRILSAVKASARQKHIPLNSSVSLNKPMYNDDDGKFFTDLLAGGWDNPEALLIGRETLNDIGEIIQHHLSRMESRVLLMHLQGMRYADIASVLNKNVKSIDNTLQRARRKINKQMQQANQANS